MGTTFEGWMTAWNNLRAAVLLLSIATMFGPLSPLRLLLKAMKGIFGIEGTIAGAATATKAFAAEKLFAEGGALSRLFIALRSYFGAEGALAVWLTTMKVKAQWMMIDFKASRIGLFLIGLGRYIGPESAIGGWLSTMKVRAQWLLLDFKLSKVGLFIAYLGSLFGEGSALARFGIWVTNLMAPVKILLVGAEVGKTGGIIGSFFNAASWVFRMLMAVARPIKAILSPIMWLVGMGLTGLNFLISPFKAILWPITAILSLGALLIGFVKGFLGTEGSFSEKVVGGLKMGFQYLVDFLVVDIAIILQDIINWFFEQVNKAAEYIPFFDGFEKVTFGDDLKKASDSFINNMVDGWDMATPETKLTAKSLKESKFGKTLEEGGLGKLTEGVLSFDPKMLTKICRYYDYGKT